MTDQRSSVNNVSQIPDYETYLTMERRQLLVRYARVERDLGNKRLEYAQVLQDEKRTKGNAWTAAIRSGMSATAADKAADHKCTTVVCESIQMRAELDVLEREAAFVLFLLREAA